MLFDAVPTSSQTISAADPGALELLVSGAAPASPPAPDSQCTLTRGAHAQQGLAAAASRKLQALPDSPAAPLLRRYSRLLLLEEAAMEQVGCGRGGWGAEVLSYMLQPRLCWLRRGSAVPCKALSTHQPTNAHLPAGCVPVRPV